MITIDDVITALQDSKEEHGGDTEIRIALSCNGNADCVEIENVVFSKVFGLRLEVSPPWWMFPKKC